METFDSIDKGNAAALLEKVIGSLEQTYRLHITVHDHKGLLSLPDGRNILPGRNRHRCECCQWQLDPPAWEKCLGHCKHEVMRNPAKTPYRLVCWRQLTEIIVPVYRGQSHLATIFAGTFRIATAELNGFPAAYQELYRNRPLWDVDKGREIALLLQIIGNGMVQLSERLYEESRGNSGRAALIGRFFNHHAERDVKPRDLAKYLGLSASRTGHLLREYFNASFTALLNEERIRRAKALLTENSSTIREIAERVGYSNEFYFSRIFSKTVGTPPGTYRRRNLKSQ